MTSSVFKTLIRMVDLDEMKSTSGHIFTLKGGVVASKSTKQTGITEPTMKVKFITLGKASFKVEWIKNLLANILL